MNIATASYKVLLAASIRGANRKIGLLVGVLVLLVLFTAIYCTVILAGAGIFFYWFSKFVPLWTQNAIYILFFVLFLYALLKLNAAISLCYAELSLDQQDNSVFRLAYESWKKGWGYFYNSIYSGIFLFAGQPLAICPCFLLQTNFAFSPYLYLYEEKKGFEARARSKEITAGFGWLILQRTAVYLLIGYFMLFLLLAGLLIPWGAPWYGQWFFLAVVVLSFYASLVQSQFIRQIYLESIQIHEAGETAIAGLKNNGVKKWPAAALVSIVFAVILYYGVKVSLILLERK